MEAKDFIITYVGQKETYTTADGNNGVKRYINCKQPGTSKEDEYVVTLFGSDAEQEWQVNTLIKARLHVKVTAASNGKHYMDTTASFIIPMAMIKPRF